MGFKEISIKDQLILLFPVLVGFIVIILLLIFFGLPLESPEEYPTVIVQSSPVMG